MYILNRKTIHCTPEHQFNQITPCDLKFNLRHYKRNELIAMPDSCTLSQRSLRAQKECGMHTWPNLRVVGSQVLRNATIVVPARDQARKSEILLWNWSEIKYCHREDRVLAFSTLYVLFAVGNGGDVLYIYSHILLVRVLDNWVQA